MNATADVSADLRRAREQFLAVGSLDAVNLRPGVLDSWPRSRDLHVHQDRVDLPFVREPDTDSPLMHVGRPGSQRDPDVTKFGCRADTATPRSSLARTGSRPAWRPGCPPTSAVPRTTWVRWAASPAPAPPSGTRSPARLSVSST